eukprot:190534-Pyramimonas_sp.AAC.1
MLLRTWAWASWMRRTAHDQPMGTTLATKWIISDGSETPRRWRAAESKKRAWTAGRPKKARAHGGSSYW